MEQAITAITSTVEETNIRNDSAASSSSTLFLTLGREILSSIRPPITFSEHVASAAMGQGIGLASDSSNDPEIAQPTLIR